MHRYFTNIVSRMLACWAVGGLLAAGRECEKNDFCDEHVLLAANYRSDNSRY